MSNKHNQFDDARKHSSQARSGTPVNPFEDKKMSSALPEGRHIHQEKGLKGSLYLSRVVEQQTHLLVRLLGYGLLVSALLDYIYILIPPRFTDPAWELQTIKTLVEHVTLTLLGLMLVFYRPQGYIRKREKNLLGLLSWVSLLVGVLYLLMVPLGIVNAGRIYHANNAQIATQVSDQSQRLQQVKAKLNQAKTDQQLKQLVAAVTPPGRSLQIKNHQTVKKQSLARVSQAEQSIILQSDRVRSNQTQVLIKNALKSSLGALISGVLFIWIWHLSQWARIRQS